MGLYAVQEYNQRQQQQYATRTGIVVDIQNIGKNKRTIALKAKQELKEVYNGVWLGTDVLDFEKENFTNVYNLFWDATSTDLTAAIHSEQYPYYLYDYIKKDPKTLAVINGSFFFLIDVLDREPKDYPFHFCVRESEVIGLPSNDEAIIYTVGRKLHAKKTRATGTIQIADSIVTWTGAQSATHSKNRKSSVTLYNSGSAKLIKEFDSKTGVRVGVLDNARIHTPLSSEMVDLVVNRDKVGMMKITDIKQDGHSHFFDGLFILHMNKRDNTYHIGDTVKPITLDGLELSIIESGMTVNKSVWDPYFYVPERINSRDARSVIAQDKNGNIHFIVFDGSKYIPKFKGVSANDIISYISKDKYEWAYFLDGGSSSRIIVKDGQSYRFLANEFAFKKITNETFLWDWKRHRKLASSIALKCTTF